MAHFDNQQIVDEMAKSLEVQHLSSSDSKNTTINEPSKENGDSNDEFEDAESEEQRLSDVEESDSDSDQQKKELESQLTPEQIEENTKKAVELKNRGNEMFRAEKLLEASQLYTQALKCCPLSSTLERSMIYNNRAAAKTKQNLKESAVKDCTKAINLNPKYVKALHRRAKLYEEMEELDRSIADYEELKTLDPGNQVVIDALRILPKRRDEQHEKLKQEMLGKLKDLGNLVLRPFGLSTDNFQMNQDPNTGSYSFNFKQ